MTIYPAPKPAPTPKAPKKGVKRRNPKRYSNTDSPRDREIILAKREGFLRCMTTLVTQHSSACRICDPCEHCRATAARVYPFPPRVVPRTEVDPDDPRRSFRVVNDKLECACGGAWVELKLTEHNIPITPKRAALWADLFARPNVEVPDND